MTTPTLTQQIEAIWRAALRTSNWPHDMPALRAAAATLHQVQDGELVPIQIASRCLGHGNLACPICTTRIVP